MSHNIVTWDFSLKTSTKDINAHCEAKAEHDDWEEGGGLLGPVRFIDRIFDTRDEAIRYIDSIRGVYDNIAVKYKESTPNLREEARKKYYTDKVNKSIADMQEKIKDFGNKRYNVVCYDVKSAYISCPKCGSKLSTERLRAKKWNDCPLCCESLLSPTKTKQRDTYQKNSDDLYHKLQAVREDLDKKIEEYVVKNNKNAEVRWVVKFEYHT